MSPLEAFKTDPNKYPPFAILTFFDELLDSKGLAFVRCDQVEAETLNKHDLVFCIDFLRAFYSDFTLYKNCVEKFNHKSRDFDFYEFMRKTGPIRMQIYEGAKIPAYSEKTAEEFRFE